MFPKGLRMEPDENFVTVEFSRYLKMITTLDACCARAGVNSWDELYKSVADMDKAIRAFVCDEDGGKKIMEWWNSRDF